MTPPAHRPPTGRRQLLQGLAALVFLGPALPGEVQAMRLHFSHGGSQREAIRLGRLYLDARPAERDAARLREYLPPACGLADSSFDCEAFAKQRATDFATGDTVVLDGWVLARSEARLLALTALS